MRAVCWLPVAMWCSTAGALTAVDRVDLTCQLDRSAPGIYPVGCHSVATGDVCPPTFQSCRAPGYMPWSACCTDGCQYWLAVMVVVTGTTS